MDNLADWKHLWSLTASLCLPELPPPKEFKPKFVLPTLNNYNAIFPNWFWAMVPANLVAPAVSLVDPVRLSKAAVRSGFLDLPL